ncbi:MAG: M15 family metallopeptidase [Minicystis sp.]
MTSEADGAPPSPRDIEPSEAPLLPPRADAPPARSSGHRRVQLALLFVGGVAVVAVNLYLIQGGPPRAGTAAPAASGAAGPLAHGESNGVRFAGPAASGAPAVEADAGPAEADAGPTEADAGPTEADAGPGDEPPRNEEPPRADSKPSERKSGTVEWVAKRACTTAPIEGLSRQIIAEARCLDANAFARVPARKNLESAGHVFLYLDAPARDHLLRVLDANPKRVMKVHSALRTVAQQYLLSRWATEKRCGIQLATRPGESNHETGLALDVSGHATWRAALEREGFRWLGAIDRVHFDFVGPGAVHHDGLDVRAFQRLWNRNHPGDTISETGRYDVPTELRLKKSPAGGFPLGARCGEGRDERHASSAPARGRAR